MSLKAMLWAMDDAPVDDAQTLLVLIALCERADETGRNAWPSVAWLAERGRCSTRTVHRHLRLLEEAGLVVRGDQRLVQHLRQDRRPVVWDLPGVRGDSLSPREVERGDTGGSHGVTPGAERGDTAVTQTVLSLTGETVPENTSTEPEGFSAFWASYPRRVGKGAARKSWVRAVKSGVHWSVIVAAAATYASHHAARRTEARYIANPATWLNQERWTDDLPEVTPFESAEARALERVTDDRAGFGGHWSAGGDF